MSKTKLLPCPFCGSKPMLTNNGLKLTTSGASIDGDIITYWSVRCNNCGAGKLTKEYNRTIDDIVEGRGLKPLNSKEG